MYRRTQVPTDNNEEMPRRQLGTTGEMVSCIGMGGYHIALPSVDEALGIRLIQSALDRGITFLDNCWDYNQGNSEIRMGKALADGYRDRAFLMTKIDGRTKKAAALQVDESLARLRTDRIDLVQFHEIVRFDDPDRIFAEEGAIHAALEAKKAGKIRYIGFTGHKDPHIHLRMLEVAEQNDFHFDTAQMPVNVMDAHFRSFTRNVVPEMVRRGVGVLAMKTMGDGFILRSKTVTAIECLHFALHQPTSVVITGIDSMEVLDQAFAAAHTFKPFTDQQLDKLLAKTKEAAARGKYEPFKTSSLFDSTAQHYDWLGQEPETLREQLTQ
jgi:aryl-alcohol dehydrogenase-like predicted oxidoreductase